MRTGHRRLVVFAAVIAALASSVAPAAVRPAAAIDCSLVYCATLEIVPSNGSGVGRVTSDGGELDCTWNVTRSGTCIYQFTWAHFVGGSIDVVLTLDPAFDSYACYSLVCGGVDETLTRTIRLNAGDDRDVFPGFSAAVKAKVTMRGIGGNGSGRVTSVPAGLDCRWLGGVKSGTCSADFYFLPASSYHILLSRNPDAGSYACSTYPPFCGTPGVPYQSTLGVSPDYESAPPAQFYAAGPVAVTITGKGSVTSDPAGIACPGTCSLWMAPGYSPDHFTTMTATAAAGWVIKDWTGACDSATGATCTFYNGLNGATIGVVFASTATPPPTARPTRTPTPTAAPNRTTPPSGGAPTPAAPGAGFATPGPAGETVPPLLGASAEPLSSVAPDPTQSVIDVTPAPGGTSDAGAGLTPAASPAAPGSADLLVLLAIGVAGLVVLLLVSFMVGRRGTRRQAGSQ